MTDSPVPNGQSERVRPSADELAESVRTLALPPDPASSKTARRFVVAALEEWGQSEICDDAAVCTAELATNAILHSRDNFTVVVRRSSRGARIDLLDHRPDRLPVIVPSSLDPLDTGTTGRGLRMIAALAERWGYFTTDVAKTVWVELSAVGPIGGPTDPLVELADRADARQSQQGPEVAVQLIDVPVRVAIASGVQVDELVRLVQLYQGDLPNSERDAFAELLEVSARPRLVGRQEAFHAAAAGRDTYSLRLTATPSEFVAIGELSVLLVRLAQLVRFVSGVVSGDVLAMRAWINSEVIAQQKGAPPTPYAGG